MNLLNQKKSNERIGFQYYPDTVHYKESDLNEWLPELKALGTQWITLKASLDRAIPENFIKGMLEEGIQPILYFNLPVGSRMDTKALVLLLGTYKKWGIKFISLFDRPNMKEEWGSASWAQQDLVERFLDIFIPLANIISGVGLTPIFPALEPGGDYWDTAFLRAALTGFKRRGQLAILNKMVLGAYGWAGNQTFNWGSGGPESWASTRPYFTPENEENHLGFRIFDWYNAISEAVLDQRLPIILMGCGSHVGDNQNPKFPDVNEMTHSFRNLQLARILSDQHQAMRDGATLEPIADNILAACFSFLATDGNHPDQYKAWYRTDGTTLPVVQAFQSWMAPLISSQAKSKKKKTVKTKNIKNIPIQSIDHYLLLSNKKFSKKLKMEFLLPFINKHHPTVGFSEIEAQFAKRVTIIGNEKSFSKEFVSQLRTKGCIVDRINGSGTSIATQLDKYEVNDAN